jgi:hypothetical protein
LSSGVSSGFGRGILRDWCHWEDSNPHLSD